MDENRVIPITEYLNLDQTWAAVQSGSRVALIQVRLTRDEKEAIQKIAKSRKVSMSKLIQDWIEKGCK